MRHDKIISDAYKYLKRIILRTFLILLLIGIFIWIGLWILENLGLIYSVTFIVLLTIMTKELWMYLIISPLKNTISRSKSILAIVQILKPEEKGVR